MTVEIIMNDAIRNMSIEALDLSARSEHCFARSGIKTVGEVIDQIDELHKIRNMGESSINHVKCKIVDLSISQMSDRQLKNFWYGVLENGSKKELKKIFEKAMKVECGG